MQDLKVSSVNHVKPNSLALDQIRSRVFVGYGLCLLVISLIAGFSRPQLSVSDTSNLNYVLTHCLMIGWFILIPFHIRLQTRITNLEQQLAESESFRRS